VVERGLLFFSSSLSLSLFFLLLFLSFLSSMRQEEGRRQWCT